MSFLILEDFHSFVGNRNIIFIQKSNILFLLIRCHTPLVKFSYSDQMYEVKTLFEFDIDTIIILISNRSEELKNTVVMIYP